MLGNQADEPRAHPSAFFFFFLNPWLPIFVYSWFEWLHNYRTIHLVLTWFFFCSQLWLTAGFIPGWEVVPFWTFFRLLGSTWAILCPLASSDSEKGSGFPVEMDQAWIFRDYYLHGLHWWAHLPQKLCSCHCRLPPKNSSRGNICAREAL